MALFLDQSITGVTTSEIILWTLVALWILVVIIQARISTRTSLKPLARRENVNSNDAYYPESLLQKYRNIPVHVQIQTDVPKNWQKITLSSEEKKLLEPSDLFALYLARLLKSDHNIQLMNNPRSAGEKYWIDVNLKLLRKCYHHDIGQDVILPQKGKNHNPAKYLTRRIKEVEGILFEKKKKATC